MVARKHGRMLARKCPSGYPLKEVISTTKEFAPGQGLSYPHTFDYILLTPLSPWITHSTDRLSADKPGKGSTTHFTMLLPDLVERHPRNERHRAIARQLGLPDPFPAGDRKTTSQVRTVLMDDGDGTRVSAVPVRTSVVVVTTPSVRGTANQRSTTDRRSTASINRSTGTSTTTKQLSVSSGVSSGSSTTIPIRSSSSSRSTGQAVVTSMGAVPTDTATGLICEYTVTDDQNKKRDINASTSPDDPR